MIEASERCDKCGAPAMVKAYFTLGLLYFCGHHANKFEIKDKAFYIEVDDQVKELIR